MRMVRGRRLASMAGEKRIRKMSKHDDEDQFLE